MIPASPVLALLLAACSPDQDIVVFEPDIVVSAEERGAEAVVFDDLVLGVPAQAAFEIGNVGRGLLSIEGVVAPAPFTVRWASGELESGAVVRVTVDYVPTAQADHRGLIQIVSTDPDEPLVSLPVEALPRAPDLVVDPGEVLFPDPETGGTEPVVVRNQGEGPLRITGLGLVDDGGGVFSLLTASLPERIEPGDTALLEVEASSADGAAGALRILSNDPDAPILGVPLSIGGIDDSCIDDSWAPGTVEIDDACVFDGIPPVWDPVVEATWRAFPTHSLYDYGVGAPSAGRVTDDDGDGDVDEDDPVDICVVTTTSSSGTEHLHGVLRLLASDGSVEHWSVEALTWDGELWEMLRAGSCALGDIDVDGLPDVVTGARTRDGEQAVAAFDHTGALMWMQRVDAAGSIDIHGAPALADLEGDGEVEVIWGATILAGADGAVLGAGDGPLGSTVLVGQTGPKSFPVDLDGDGVMEVIAGPVFLAPDGSTICEADVDDGTPAAADLDGDGLGEVVLVSPGEVVLLEHDCTITDSWALPDGGNGGTPTLADFDGDGQVEIGLASKYYYFVFETDGSVLWQAPIRDESSSATGSAVFDFDGDGASEVVFADEFDLFVIDGATGRARFLWPDHASRTATEYPTVADVDDDGSAEIIVVHAGTFDYDEYAPQEPGRGLSIVGSASSGWMPARPVWNQHAFHMTHVEDDLSIPTDTSPNWPALNSFRSADTVGSGTTLDRNARPAVVDVCNDDCDEGSQRIVVRVENPGTAPLPGDVEVVLVSELADEPVVIARQTVGVDIDPGTTSAGLVFDVDLSLLSTRRVSVVVDPDDRIAECDESDNEIELVSGLCP
ncbi:MAG: VCBS repeat-containing protein [Alphaproteobacteria bacterium]|nr:VCBS repeat-containing protein [Alphaproteobacteria bacterium]